MRLAGVLDQVNGWPVSISPGVLILSFFTLFPFVVVDAVKIIAALMLVVNRRFTERLYVATAQPLLSQHEARIDDHLARGGALARHHSRNISAKALDLLRTHTGEPAVSN